MQNRKGVKKTSNKTITLKVLFFSILRETAGKKEQTIKTEAKTAFELYQDLNKQYHFSIEQNNLRVAINDSFRTWQSPLNNGDKVVFIPPISGG